MDHNAQFECKLQNLFLPKVLDHYHVLLEKLPPTLTAAMLSEEASESCNKGQLISKGHFVSSILPKNKQKTKIQPKSAMIPEIDFFVHFLEELRIPESPLKLTDL